MCWLRNAAQSCRDSFKRSAGTPNRKTAFLKLHLFRGRIICDVPCGDPRQQNLSSNAAFAVALITQKGEAMSIKFIDTAILAVPLLIVSPAIGDPWKDESGHGKHGKRWKEERGEPPWWDRGKGYWDGQLKHRGKWKEDRGEPPWRARGKGYWGGDFKHGPWAPPAYDFPLNDCAPVKPYSYSPAPPPAVSTTSTGGITTSMKNCRRGIDDAIGPDVSK